MGFDAVFIVVRDEFESNLSWKAVSGAYPLVEHSVLTRVEKSCREVIVVAAYGLAYVGHNCSILVLKVKENGRVAAGRKCR